MKPHHVLLLALAAASACSSSTSRGDWDAPPRGEGGDGTGAARAPVMRAVAPPIEAAGDAKPVGAPAPVPQAAPPQDPAPTEVSLHPNAPALGLLDLLDAQLAVKAIDKSVADWRLRVPSPPAVPVETRATYHWVLHTNVGLVRVQLLPQWAPHHVLNIAWLTRLGFYDGLSFHRVIPGFMAQGGCPRGDGKGAPAYKLDGEFPPGGPRHDRRGIVSMANAGPGTDGSQFFVTFDATPWLDGKHTIFGEVIDSEPALQALEANGSRPGLPRVALRIERAELLVR
ncbi:MAG: peptidylprolyl isomerase [Planctomycetes bacterium]|nr:peptidylprolyl isomerase [Planctomycetota bacterium]